MNIVYYASLLFLPNITDWQIIRQYVANLEYIAKQRHIPINDSRGDRIQSFSRLSDVPIRFILDMSQDNPELFAVDVKLIDEVLDDIRTINKSTVVELTPAELYRYMDQL